MSDIKEHNGYYLSIRTDCTNLNNGIVKVLYDVELCHSQELSNSVITLWLRNAAIDGKAITDLQFISDVKLGEINTGSFEIDYSAQLLNNPLVVYGITFEIVLDNMDATIEVAAFKHLITPYPLTEDGVYNYFLKLNHNKKSHNNLIDLSKIMSDAYQVSPALANKMWNNLWDENRLLKGLQKRYFIIVIYRNLTRLMGIDNATALLLMEDDRLELALEQDFYGTDEVLKGVGTYYIKNAQYNQYINVLNEYQIINNKTDYPVVDDKKLAGIIRFLLECETMTFDKLSHQKIITVNEFYFGDDQLIGWLDYLSHNHFGSRFYYLTLAYVSLLKGTPIDNKELVIKCGKIIVEHSFDLAINFLYLHRDALDSAEIDTNMRSIISHWGIRDELLDEKKEWVETILLNPKVFLGFFEMQKGLLSDYVIDFMIKLMVEGRWDQLQECFELVLKHGDLCRKGSLLSFISNTIQSWKRIYTSSTLNVDDGPFKIKIEMKHSVFCGIEYTEIASIDKPNMIKYKDLLYKLLNKIPSESRDSQTLSKSIQDLEDRLV